MDEERDKMDRMVDRAVEAVAAVGTSSTSPSDSSTNHWLFYVLLSFPIAVLLWAALLWFLIHTSKLICHEHGYFTSITIGTVKNHSDLRASIFIVVQRSR
ncbi:hypothetical protein Ancab_016277 [Ancistrocladus abbreviatus]